MRAMFHRILGQLVVTGRLVVTWPDGRMTTYGADSETQAHVRLRNWATVRRLIAHPSLACGEAYMDGGLEPVDCTIYELLDVLMTNLSHPDSRNTIFQLRESLARLIRSITQFNPAKRARRNVAHHYDLNGRLYSLFLDADQQYSCAYFPTGNETLEEAQAAKKLHIAAKLCLDRPDLSVLDIGCGWGGMALTLARDFGARVTGITLSTEQLEAARKRAADEGLSNRVSFELLDYRALPERFQRPWDRIVSVGMFEHVGVPHYSSFFDVVRRSLAPDGVALLHSIGRMGPPGATNPWIEKHIFPGGYCPALSEVLPSVEKSGLLTTDVEILRIHYAETLRHWRRRFAANRNIIASLYDERFCRMFEFYFCASELAFRRDDQMVFQVQLTRDRAAAPLTRDYIAAAERARVAALPVALDDMRVRSAVSSQAQQ